MLIETKNAPRGRLKNPRQKRGYNVINRVSINPTIKTEIII